MVSAGFCYIELVNRRSRGVFSPKHKAVNLSLAFKAVKRKLSNQANSNVNAGRNVLKTKYGSDAYKGCESGYGAAACFLCSKNDGKNKQSNKMKKNEED